MSASKTPEQMSRTERAEFERLWTEGVEEALEQAQATEDASTVAAAGS